MISKIFNSVFNFMSNPYVVIILTVITDVYMYMDDMAMENGIYGFSAVISYTIIIPLILMMFYKCLPYAIPFCIGVVIGLVIIIKCIFKS